jgi:hypothetical protein
MRKAYDTRVDPSHGAFARKMAVALGLFAILFNHVSGLTFGFKPAGLAERALANGWIVICSGDGFRVIDQDGKPIDLPKHDGKPHCAFCLPMMHGDALPAQDLAIALRQESATLECLPHPQVLVSTGKEKQAWPRAPPGASLDSEPFHASRGT